jgi:diguanylate cyclase (GGDEF)-like protein
MSKKQTVLIIEDSPLTVKILSDMLQDEYEILSAFSGGNGYEIASKEYPDIILLDVVMSGMDGFEVCKNLKKNSLTKDIPVIFITSLGEMEDEQKGLEIGAIDYISKPFSEPIVKVRVRNHLELKRTHDILSDLSSRDGLTGICNRRSFDNNFKFSWESALAKKALLSLMLIDIDHFKIYNDNYGHLEGDECLRLVAQCISDCVNRRGDFVARFGGEEFACFLLNEDLENSLIMAVKILDAIRSLKIPFSHSDVAPIVTVSIGLATILPTKEFMSVDFIKQADDLLYDAKHKGRNQIQYAKIK